MKPNANNVGGRTILANQYFNHQNAVSNAKPTLNTRSALPIHPSAKLTPEQRVQRKQKALFEMDEVYAAFKKVQNVKKGRIDTAPPAGCKIVKSIIPMKQKQNDFINQEHALHLKSQQNKIRNVGKSMIERKKNPYDPVAHPSHFFRGPGQSEDIKLDAMVKTLYGRKSSVDFGTTKTKGNMRPISASVKKNKYHSPVKMEKSTYDLDFSEKKGESGEIEIPLFVGNTPEDYRSHKREIIDLIIEHEIYKFQDLKDLSEKIITKNKHMDRNKLVAIFDQINEELDK